MKREMVSVVIPTYNAERSIIRCLDSVCRQTYRNLEIIIIDDGSTDNTVEICNELKCRDERISVYHFDNHGVSWARNKGIAISSGEFLLFVDSDDWIDPRMVEKLMQYSDRADLVICGVNIISAIDGSKSLQLYGRNKYSVEEYLNSLTEGKLNPFFGGIYNKLFCKDKIDLYHIRFQEGNTYGEDMCFNIDYLQICNSVYIVPEGLYNYMIGQQGTLTFCNYNNMDYREFWAQEMFLYNKYRLLMQNNNILCDDILLGLWKVFISKVNKNMHMPRKERVKVLFQFLKENKIRKKLYAVKTKSWKDKVCIWLLSNRVVLIFLCGFLDIKHCLNIKKNKCRIGENSNL